MTSSNLALCFLVTSQNTAGSDHFPICTSIGGTFIKKHVFAYKIKIDNKKIRILNQKLSASFANFKDNASANTIDAY